jgi:hypothetical protein
MKKFAALLIMISLILTGCQETKTKPSNTVVEESPIESINPTPSASVKAEATKVPNVSAIPKETKPVIKVVEADAISKLIPKGMFITKLYNEKDALIKGDLNKDGISDVAVILDDNADTLIDRDLMIAFGTKEGSYEQSIYAKKAIMCKDCGGVFGDPLDNLTISNGSILLSLYGGSSDRWYYKYRFQFRDNNWYLIGETSGHSRTTDLSSGTELDINLITGDYIEKQSNKEGNLVESKRGKKEKKKLTLLMDFNKLSDTATSPDEKVEAANYPCIDDNLYVYDLDKVIATFTEFRERTDEVTSERGIDQIYIDIGSCFNAGIDKMISVQPQLKSKLTRIGTILEEIITNKWVIEDAVNGGGTMWMHNATRNSGVAKFNVFIYGWLSMSDQSEDLDVKGYKAVIEKINHNITEASKSKTYDPEKSADLEKAIKGYTSSMTELKQIFEQEQTMPSVYILNKLSGYTIDS